MTSLWYQTVLLKLDSGSKVLDVGMGTCTSLLANQSLISEKELVFVGVDYNEDYVLAAKRNISKTETINKGSVESHFGSVYDELLLQSITPKNKFDAIYFSGSLSLMPEPIEALKVSSSFLKKDGRIFITQTYQNPKCRENYILNLFLKNVKPLLKYITTVDFGQLIYEDDMLQVFQESGFTIVEHAVIFGSVDNVWQKAFLTVLKVS